MLAVFSLRRRPSLDPPAVVPPSTRRSPSLRVELVSPPPRPTRLRLHRVQLASASTASNSSPPSSGSPPPRLMAGTITGLNPRTTLTPYIRLLSPSLRYSRSVHLFNPTISPIFNPTCQPIRASTMSTPPSPPHQHQEPPYPVDALNIPEEEVLQFIKASLDNCLSETNLHLTVPGLSSKTRGKVRDIYDAGDYLVLVTTDRQSAFDRVLASIPFKGQILNETSLWWFNNTLSITPNAIVATPDKNVTIAKKCSVFPVEFVVRGYVTGSTDTSLWTVYKNGVRNYCGNALPDGLIKNQRLSTNIITPTTKAADHDVPVTPDEIIELGLMTKDEYDEARSKALSLFKYGQRVALEHNLILVDTKYEFGKSSDGSILLIDEVHTPDSSRYWIASSYEKRLCDGLEPENVDKELLRLWFKDRCNPYEDEILPDAPKELVTMLAWRYIFLFETITGSKFDFPNSKVPIHDRISENVASALARL